jgi:HSP20 family protein
MSARKNPFEEMERLFERMSRQFDQASRMWESSGPLAEWSSDGESMELDLIERDEEFVVTVDLPGFERDGVEIEVTDHTLRIAAQREAEHEVGDEQYLRHERRHESVERSIRLPDEVDKERVDARMRNGVLTVTLPKIEGEQARRIEIEGE